MQKKGDPKIPGSGRKKGTPNKVTQEVQELNDRILALIKDDRVIGVANLLKATLESKPEALLAYIEKQLPNKIDFDINHKQIVVHFGLQGNNGNGKVKK